MIARRDPVEASRRWFDRWAPRYERGLGSGWLAMLQRDALQALELGPSDRVLDVGCGTGAAVREAASMVERAVGIDLSPAMVARAKELAQGLPNVEFREAESGRLPFADGAFTALLCTTSFHHYPDPLAATAEMARVLAPGGRLVIGDPSGDRLVTRLADRVLRVMEPGHVHIYGTQELGEILNRAGFVRVRVRRLHSGGYAIWWAGR